MHLVPTAEFSLDEPAVNRDALEKIKDSEVLKVIKFGNPILRKKASLLTRSDILSD